MGWTDKFKDLFKRPTEKETTERTLAEHGVKTVEDMRLRERIAIQFQFQSLMSEPIRAKKPETHLARIKDRLDQMNTVIAQTSSPYARAGDNPAYRRMLQGWSRWYALASSWIICTNDYFLTEEENPIDYGCMDAGAFVRMLEDVIQKHVMKDGFTVLNVCFRDKDVSEKAVTVIQTLQGKQAIPLGTES